MKITDGGLRGLMLVQLDVHRDHRGFFVERFNEESFSAHGLPSRYAQDNHSRSEARVVRGMHFQYAPRQGKLVGVVRGRVWDVVVDIRPDSPSFGKYWGVELNGDNGLLLWVPFGFAHGYCVLGEEPADLIYKVDALYNPKAESGIHWSDSEIAIPWPVENPIVSARDDQMQSFADFKTKMSEHMRGAEGGSGTK